jgi:choloylglycine hydrolase
MKRLLLMALSCLVSASYACTSILLTAQDGGHVYGRTMEFGLNLHSGLVIIPRGVKLTSTGSGGISNVGGKTWTTKYGVVGANGLGALLIFDGINEKGLAGGLFNFPTYASFKEPNPSQDANTVGSGEILNYILTNYATVDEVKANLPSVHVAGVKYKVYHNQSAPAHFSVHDTTGNSIVIEYVNNGELHIYDNPTHVLTNSPPFPFQLANLAQYQYVTAAVLPPLNVNGISLQAPSSGDGMNGIPGGFLATARFVRAYFASANVPTLQSTDDAVAMSFHIMGGLELPPGSIQTSATGGGEGGGVSGYETTEWTSAADMKNMRYYIRTYSNPDIRMIDLMKVNFNAKEVKYIVLDQLPHITDLTPQ